MTTAHFTQKARRALVPMRKATVDTFLLGTIILLILFASGVLFTFPWLIIFIFAVVYLIAVVLRLRKTASAATVALSQEPSLEEATQTLSSEKTRIGLMLSWGQQRH